MLFYNLIEKCMNMKLDWSLEEVSTEVKIALTYLLFISDLFLLFIYCNY